MMDDVFAPYSTDNGTQPTYRTQYSAADEGEASEQYDYYELCLLIQNMLQSMPENVLEFPVDKQHLLGYVANDLSSDEFSSVSRGIAKGQWIGENSIAYKRILPSFNDDGRDDMSAAIREVIHELRSLSHPKIRSHANVIQLRGVSFEAASYE
jgi:hypothetical protein